VIAVGQAAPREGAYTGVESLWASVGQSVPGGCSRLSFSCAVAMGAPGRMR
jgi:hypothetical protein